MTEEKEFSLNMTTSNFNVFYHEKFVEFYNSFEIRYQNSLVYQIASDKKEVISILESTQGLSAQEKLKYFIGFKNNAENFCRKFENQYDCKDSNYSKILGLLKFGIFINIGKILFDDYIKSLDNNNDSTNKQIIPAFEYICSQYQQFRHDLELLKEKQIITQNADGYLSWNKSKKSLAEYFAYLACGDTNHQIEKKERIGWKTIENVFRKTGLKNTLSSAKQYDKRSRDFECILEVLAKK